MNRFFPRKVLILRLQRLKRIPTPTSTKDRSEGAESFQRPTRGAENSQRRVENKRQPAVQNGQPKPQKSPEDW